MKKIIFIILAMALLIPSICSALGGETSIEYRDGEVMNKFITSVEFNQKAGDRLLFYGKYTGINIDYINGTFIPSMTEYTAGFDFIINDELTLEIQHHWQHIIFPVMDNGQYDSFKIVYRWGERL